MKSNQYSPLDCRNLFDFPNPTALTTPPPPISFITNRLLLLFLSPNQTKPKPLLWSFQHNNYYIVVLVSFSLCRMAVDLAGGLKKTRMEEQIAIQEAASAGLKSMEHLIRVLSSQSPSASSSSSSSHNNSHHHRLDLNQLDCTEITDFTVSKFKQVINLLNRTGHARFRRAPCNPSPPPPQPQVEKVNHVQHQTVSSMPPQGLTLDFAKPVPVKSEPNPNACTDLSVSQYSSKSKDTYSISPPMSTTTSSFMSSITGDGSVSDGKIGPSILAASGKPPLSSSHGKRCNDATLSGKVSSSARCHCSKRRYLFPKYFCSTK